MKHFEFVTAAIIVAFFLYGFGALAALNLNPLLWEPIIRLLITGTMAFFIIKLAAEAREE